MNLTSINMLIINESDLIYDLFFSSSQNSARAQSDILRSVLFEQTKDISSKVNFKKQRKASHLHISEACRTFIFDKRLERLINRIVVDSFPVTQ